MKAARTLTHAEAKAFYDGFGRRQDAQAFYEQGAVDDLCAHADFKSASSVVEFGCGTGRFAEALLGSLLPPEVHYVGLDLSETMVELTRERIRPFGNRAEARTTDGSPGRRSIDSGLHSSAAVDPWNSRS